MVAGACLLGERLWQPSCAEARSLGEGRLLLFKPQTSERLDITYRDAQGRYDTGALEVLNYFMRCHYSNKVAGMDRRVLETLNMVHAQVGRDKEIILHSAYRSPEYHRYLIKHNEQVARHSYHVSAQAIDFHIQGVPLRSVCQHARRLGRGGVGYYPKQQFLHVDCGPTRYW
ncbi:hypothetical protein YTPLAS18_33450 [Nitrospira sp.]|nr:hypothetical protein YTPLAS18_33450 [Nitrospira sp.]